MPETQSTPTTQVEPPRKLRTKSGCLTCRVRHLKCDETKPTCLRCIKANRTCVAADNAPVSFRHGQNPSTRRKLSITTVGGVASPTQTQSGFAGLPGFASFQSSSAQIPYGERDRSYPTDANWVGIPTSLTFIDETRSIAANYVGGEEQLVMENSFTPANSPGVSMMSPMSTSSAITTTQGYGPSTQQHTHSVMTYSSPQHSFSHSPQGSVASLHDSTAGVQVQQEETTVSVPAIPKPIRKPLATRDDARLLRLFAQVWGPGLDCTDFRRHFTLSVPARALDSSILLHAILAVSTLQESRENKNRQMEEISQEMERAAEWHYDECVRLLIPSLGDNEKVMVDDGMLAATVILRVYEQMHATLPSTDPEHHLSGSSALITACPPLRTPHSAPSPSTTFSTPLAPGSGTPLRKAAFWVYLRQDIYMAILNQRGLKVDPGSLGDLDSAVDEVVCGELERECGHANRIVALTAGVIQFCYGGGGSAGSSISASASPDVHSSTTTSSSNAADSPTRHARHTTLTAHLNTWRQNRPASFEPWYYRSADAAENRRYPEIMLGPDWVVTAWLYEQMAEALLGLYDPGQRGATPRRRRGLEASMRKHAHNILGIVQSNPRSEARRIACHGLFICAPFLEEDAEREDVMAFLGSVEREDGWPTGRVRDALVREWGG
ncbi:hypothetical protein BZA77DRAFT_326509 [Pyronema omphalodes]|nr:hypothetical protein BZA77DRAFT_326509 [Pyronema omphalodes]